MSRARRPRVVLTALLLATATFAAACSGSSGAATTTPASPAAPTEATAAPAATQAPAATEAPTAAPTVAPTAAAAFPVTITGYDGTDVTLKAAPAKIVSLTPAATETLFALGAGDKVVARSEDPNPYPAEAAKIPAVTSMMTVDVEKIIAAEPDLVIAGGLGFTSDDAIKQLRAAGLPVLVVYAENVAGVLDDIRTVGAAVGQADAAATLTAKMQTDLDTVSKAATAAAGATPPRVFYEIDASGDIYGPADKSFIAEMLTLAGAKAITTGSPDVYSIPLEKLIAADPQVILLGDAAYGVTADAVKARNGWGAMTAVKDGAIRPVDDVVVTRPGPRLAEGLKALAQAVNPGLTLP